MKKYLFLIVSLFLLLVIPREVVADTVNYKEVFTKVYGSENDDIFNSAVFVNDEEFVVVGQKGSLGLIVKYNIDGEVLWEREASSNSSFLSVVLSDNGSVFAVGSSSVSKYDKDGNLLWEKSYDGTFKAAAKASDNGLVVVGSSGLIVRYDKDGNILWSSKLSDKNLDSYRSVEETNDGGFIVAGLTYSKYSLYNTCTAFIVKYDKDGQMEWWNNFGGTSSDEFSGVVQTYDGSYVAVGRTYSSEYVEYNNSSYSDALLVKYDKDGRMVWHKVYGGSSNDRFKAIYEDENNNLVVAGFSNSSEIGKDGGYDSILVTFSSTGDFLNLGTTGENGNEEIDFVIKNSIGDYIIGGSSDSPSIATFGKTDAIVIKYSTFFNINSGDSSNVEVTIDKSSAIAGEVATVDLKVKEGYELKKISVVRVSDGKDVTDVVQFNAETYTFVMPNYDVEILVDVVEISNPKTDVMTSISIIVIIMIVISSCLLYAIKNNNFLKNMI